jgi:hypothetical protein
MRPVIGPRRSQSCGVVRLDQVVVVGHGFIRLSPLWTSEAWKLRGSRLVSGMLRYTKPGADRFIVTSIRSRGRLFRYRCPALALPERRLVTRTRSKSRHSYARLCNRAAHAARTRYAQLAHQYSEDCGTFMHKLGLGGPCPHCDEPVAVTELQDEEVALKG